MWMCYGTFSLAELWADKVFLAVSTAQIAVQYKE